MSSESLTVEETNALRAQMGLPPLRTAAAQQPPQSSSPPPLEGSDDSAATLSHLRSELSRRKQARLASALLSAPSLSQQLSFQTGGAAAAWVERSRRVMEEERVAAEQRRQAEAEQQRRQREEANKYGSAHLRGLRIAHQYDEFDADEQQATVLVLRDKKIGEAGDDEDELINDDMDERARKQRADKDNERRKGRAWEDDLEGGPRLLSKYDEEEEKEGIILGGGGVYGREEDEKRRRQKEAEERDERLREGWVDGTSAVTQEYDMSSTTERKIDSDYKQVKFKRKPKPHNTQPTKPTRSTTAAASDDWIDQLERQALSSGGKSSQSQQQSVAQVDEEKKEKRVTGYLRAMEKGEEATRRRLERDREEQAEAERRRRATTLQEVEDEDEELAAALAKARRVTAKEREAQVVRVKVEGEEEGRPVTIGRDSETKRMAERIRSERETGGDGTVKREVKTELNGVAADGDEVMEGVQQDDGSIVFTSVSNFASGLQGVDDDDRLKRERSNGLHKDAETAVVAMAEERPVVKVKREPARQQSPPEPTERSGWIRYDESSEQPSEGQEEGDEAGTKEEEEDEEVDEDVDESDEDDEGLGDEPLASEGVAAALALAKRRAYLSSTSTAAAPTSFTLTQYDPLGRELSAKEQFRALSHAFHGQGAGWNKKDKRARSLRREVGVMRKRADMGVAEGAEKALEAQKRLGQAFIVLEGDKQQTQRVGGAAVGGGGGGGGGTDSVAKAAKRVKR